MRKLLPLIIGLASIVSFSSVSAWQHIEGPRPSSALAVTLDPSGNIIAAGQLLGDFGIVVKISSTDGATLWRTVVSGPGSGPTGRNGAYAVAVDGNGDVVAGGTELSGVTGGRLFVVKLSGADGTELWRTQLVGTAVGPEGPDNAARAIAIDSNGDVVVGGDLVNGGTSSDFAVIKLSGSDGSEVWRLEDRRTELSSDFFLKGRTVAVDTNGDVIATGVNLAVKISSLGSELWRVDIGRDGVGSIDANGDLVVFEAGPDVESAVVKRSGVDGAELWRIAMDPPLTRVFEIITDAHGDLVVGGQLQGSFLVAIKLASTNGAELWRWVSDSSAAAIGALAGDGNGDVIAAGRVGTQFTVIKLAGGDGAELWREDSDPGVARTVLVDAQGNVIAGGLVGAGENSTFSVKKLRGADGSDFVGAAELSASPATTTPGGLITGTWTGIASPTPTDWVGLYAVGTGHEEYLDWKYVGCEQSPTSEFASGACHFVVPSWLGPGYYELRLFAENGFTVLATSNTFTVSGGSEATLTVSPAVAQPGGAVTAAWSGITIPTPTDWVGLYAVERGHEEYLEWQYVGCEQTPTNGFASGSCQFVVPSWLGPGHYELRLFAENGFTLLATSNTLIVDGEP